MAITCNKLYLTDELRVADCKVLATTISGPSAHETDFVLQVRDAKEFHT
jgi:hypothetical protein